jgi:hypothetical protein
MARESGSGFGRNSSGSAAGDDYEQNEDANGEFHRW